MAFEFKLPDIGEGVHEGEIAKWLVSQGDSLHEDQPMVEVMTDKVTVEITSPVAGTVGELVYKEGDVVKVGAVIIRINESGEASAPKAAAATEAPVEQKQLSAVTASQENAATTTAPQQTPVCSPQQAARNGGKVLAPPAVRKLARAMGVDLAMVTGSGPHGRIRKDDVLSQSGGTKALAPSLTPKLPFKPGGEERIPFKGMRRRIAEHLVKSKHTAPHFSYVEEADMTDIVKFRDDLDPLAQEHDLKLTYLPFVIKAVIQGLKKYPILNATLDEEKSEIVLKHDYNIGIAVATPDGLVVPVIHHADQMTLLELAAAVYDVGTRAKNNKLTLSDLQGGTFTLTSIGSIGGLFSAPIINYPEVGIMGIHKIQKRPVVRNDEIVIREMTYLSLSGDHRVVDGAEAALFMKDVINWLEHPSRLLLV